MPDKLSQKNFHKLLSWLDPEQDKAGKKYELIHRALIKIFQSHGFSNAEDLADVTIDRVASKVDQISQTFEGEKIKYFVSVARYIQFEQSKKRLYQTDTEVLTDEQGFENAPDFINDSSEGLSQKQFECLQECLNKLKAKDKHLILEYFNTSKAQAKINDHKILAKKKSKSLNALRIQIFRIKKNLFECTRNCFHKK